MTIYLKDEATSKAVRKLAKLRGTTLTEAVRMAVQEALEAEAQPHKADAKLRALQALQAEAARLPRSGVSADKAFFDKMWGE